MIIQKNSFLSYLKNGGIMMQTSKNYKTSEKGRTFTIILSIVIALILWSYVIIQVNPTKEETISKIPVQLLNVQLPGIWLFQVPQNTWSTL